MPELPEVETVRQSIRPEVIGRQIDEIEILTPEIWLGNRTGLCGYRIADLQRTGRQANLKSLLLDQAIVAGLGNIYADGWNRRGKFQDCLMVYGRAGEPC
ncbi:MAG TPA: hypothetical protein DCM45_01905, partial [Clostridiales bacterium]|nr:hypothetical protein [Clostridiales bacterium]